MTSIPMASKQRRPDWDEYFMRLADLAATRSTCLRRQVGAILVSGHRVLATGYNGAPKGLPHCLDAGCKREELKIPSGQRQEICRAIHAEQNAIIQAAQHGVPVKNATVYCTNQPCSTCAKMILNLEVDRIVFRSTYPDDLAVSLLNEAGFERAEENGLFVWRKNQPFKL